MGMLMTAAMMGTVAPHRRGIAAGARVLVQNTGAAISAARPKQIGTTAPVAREPQAATS